MTPHTYTIIVAIVALAALYAMHRYHLWRRREVYLAGTDVLTREIGNLRMLLEDARGRADRYHTKIAEALQEREEWHQLWQQQSIGHGNAQNMMMTTIEEMGRLLSAKGIKYRLNPVLQAVRSEYLTEHEMPAREDLKQQKESATKQQTPPTPGPEAA